MTKDVIISIKGLQFEADIEGDKIEQIQKGIYYNKDGTHYLEYDEVGSDMGDLIQNIIWFRDKEMNIVKQGSINVNMIFNENKKNLATYATPFGNILVGIDTSNISYEEKERQITVNVDYALDINYEHLADCKIMMDIRSADGGDFSLN